jgi:hypothetical protein
MVQLISFLTLEFLIVILLVYLNRNYFNFRFSNFQIAIIAAFFFYISIILLVLITNHNLKRDLDAFDLNKDGNFSIEERTVGQQQTMQAVISDTGRNFAPIIGIIYSLIYFTIIMIPLSIFNRLKKTTS